MQDSTSSESSSATEKSQLEKKNHQGIGGIKEKKGHMALRNNVWETRELLWDILKPTQLRLVDAIISKTIKWRTDEAKISIEDLMEHTKQKHTHIYSILKELEAKGIILRRKNRHDLIIGLNPKYFGELLIKKHQDAVQARRNKVKIVVDNSKNLYESRTASVPNRDKTGTGSVQPLYASRTKNDTQPIENISESVSLNTLLKDISLKTSLKESQKPEKPEGIGESFTLSEEEIKAATWKKYQRQRMELGI